MRCLVCGQGMKKTSGGNYHCSNCGHTMNDLVYRPAHCDMPIPQGFGEQRGWICPVCGRGLSPWTSFCPCQGSEMQITYGTNTLQELDDAMQYINRHTVEELQL